MIKIFKIGEDHFCINYLNRKAIMVYGLAELFMTGKSLEIKDTEMEAMVLEMNKHNHNFASFGFNRGLVFTERV